MRSVLLWLFLAFAAPCLLAQRMPETSHAQQAQFSFATDREDLISLKGKWRFQPGDESAYASPTFDDSHWPLLDSNRPWSEQGYKGMSGLAWYRFRVTLPAGSEPLALDIPTTGTCYQVFADGVLLTTVGRMPPHSAAYRTIPTVVPLLNTQRNQPQTVTIALRVWHNPIWAKYSGGGPHGEAQFGDASRLKALVTGNMSGRAWHHAAAANLALIYLVAAMVSLALYSLRRSEHEYLLFAIVALCSSIGDFCGFYEFTFTSYLHVLEGTSGLVGTLGTITILFFYRALLRGRANALFWAAVTADCLGYLTMWLLFKGHLNTAQTTTSDVLLQLPGFFWILLLLLKRFRQKVTDAKLLIFPLVITTITTSLYAADNVLNTLNLASLPFSLDLIQSPVAISYSDLSELLFLLAMLAILVNRFARTSREQDRAASEFEAARSLQHVLIPDELPTIPGLSIATAYHPAQEVGGDFFQVIPLPGGETLIVIGDVSGKGLKAAMNVSVIVGALRTLAEITTSPALILAGLNRRLQSRDAGFTTCIVLRFAADNTLTLSNAGHLAPYVNGRELETEANLPLGLLESCCYQEQSIPLNPGDHLTMLTDGIPEATRRIAKKDELFGFTRTQEIAHQTAASIAQAALSFGQTDDITVLTIDLLPRTLSFDSQPLSTAA